jgi:LEA14-like dessication related protein
MRLRALLFIPLLTACGGGRTGAPDLLPPQVELTQIGMRNFGLSGGTLDAKVSIRNPNSTAIKLSGLLLNVDVQGHRFGTTDWSHPEEVGGNDTVTFVVPVDFTWRAVGLAARGILSTGDVRYEISGRTYLLHLGETWRFPYSREGSVPLVRLP